MTKPRTQDQTTVIRFVKIGVLLSVILIATGYMTLPVQEGKLSSTSDKLGFTLRWQLFLSCMLIFAIKCVGSVRFSTTAINPIDGGGEHFLRIESRFLQNTLEQMVINFIGQLVLATYLDGNNVQRVIPALVGVFVIGRIAFYNGYKMHPMYRGPGFAMTFLPSVMTHAYCIYCFCVYGPMFGFK